MAAEAKQEEEERTSEWAWRFTGLRELGLAYQDAFRLSDRPDVVHEAQALLDGGCPRELVARILL